MHGLLLLLLAGSSKMAMGAEQLFSPREARASTLDSAFTYHDLLSAQELEVLSKAENEARIRSLYKNPSPQFKLMSEAAECATSLLETPQNFGAVVLGGKYLYAILQQVREQQSANLPQLITDCSSQIARIPRRTQRFAQEEVQVELEKSLPVMRWKKTFISYILERIGEKVRCVQSDYALKTSVIFGLKLGLGSAKCETPFGRRFIRRGPLLGFYFDALGAGFFKDENALFLAQANASLYGHNSELKGNLGIGAHFGFWEKTCHLTWLKKIQPNFVPLFEYFSVKIPQ